MAMGDVFLLTTKRRRKFVRVTCLMKETKILYETQLNAIENVENSAIDPCRLDSSRLDGQCDRTPPNGLTTCNPI